MTASQDQTPALIEIRKYPNRRYYDSTRSRHVTLEDMQGLIRAGHEVRVTDSRTGEDITGKVLTQIILELDSPKLGIFPTPLLHRLIRTNEKLVQDFVEKYFNQALNAFLDSQRHFESYLRQAIGLQGSAGGMSDWARMMFGSVAPHMWPPGAAPERPSDQASRVELGEVVENLRREVEELKSRGRRPAKSRPRRRR